MIGDYVNRQGRATSLLETHVRRLGIGERIGVEWLVPVFASLLSWVLGQQSERTHLAVGERQ
jgi:hypothetical protein